MKREVACWIAMPALLVAAAWGATACGDDDGEGGGGHGAEGCPTGQQLCGGVCIDVTFDRNNCGACGVQCASAELCSFSRCDSECRGGTTACGNECVHLGTNHAHCGDCGHPCQAGEVCDGTGACRLNCIEGLANCEGQCVRLGQDSSHCGACGVACYDGQICNGQGQCAAGCVGGFVFCDGVCVDPSTDHAYCGATGDCLGPSAGVSCSETESCEAGTCTALPCDDQWEPSLNANDTEATATALESAPLGDCAPQEAVSGLLKGADDVDWYYYQGMDDTCIVNPRQLVAEASGEVRLCMFLECVDTAGATEFSCPAPTTEAMSPDGRAGCCVTGLDGDFEITDLNCTAGNDESAHVYLRVDDPAATESTCTTYGLRYNY